MKQTQRTEQTDILKQIEQGKIYPIYLLCGEEEFLVDKELTGMLELLVPGEARDFNLEIYDGIGISVDEIITSAETYPVMAERRVIVVREATFFTSKGVSSFNIFRSAVEAHTSNNPTKTMKLLAKALEIPADELAEENNAARDAIANFIEENADELTPEDRDLLSSIPEVSEQAEISPSSAAVNEAERFIQWLEGDLPTTSVVILTTYSVLDARNKLFKAIGKYGKVQTYEKKRAGRSPSEDRVYQMVVEKLHTFSKVITYSAFLKIRERVGDDIRLILGELDKLLAFIEDKPRIDESDIENLVVQSDFDEIFDLTDSIGKRALPSALSSLYSTLDGGEPPIKVHNMITRQIRLMLQAKLLIQSGGLNNLMRMDYSGFLSAYRKLPAELSAQLPKDKRFNLLKQSPYPVYLAFRQQNNFTLQELLAAMERLLEADIQLKSSQHTPDLILEQLVIDLCASSKRARWQGG